MTVTTTTAFQIGSLVRARGREWVVLPESTPDLLVLQPLGGGVDDIAGVLPDIEHVTPASFPPPTPDDLGDDRSARLLRDALRIGFRSSGGPFRCLAGIAVSPRPYQLVPLLLALRQDTVRLADRRRRRHRQDDRSRAGRRRAAGHRERRPAGGAVPAVAWPSSGAANCATKFGLEAELVLPGTITRLERNLGYGQSVFEAHQVTIVSTDFIKAEHRRNDFLRAAPDLVIIDEAHTVSSDDSGRGSAGRTQRYRLVRDLAADPNRHLLLVTATPHSGNDTAFRNLIGLTNPDLREADLGSDAGRALLAEHMVQRRRADIRSYLGADTQFPADRKTAEVAYTLSPAHRALFDDVLAYVRGQVQDKTGTKLQQRIRWWSALSLLRSMASSPAAAAATLSTRAANVEAHSSDAADAIGAAEILDQVEDDSLDSADATPGALVEDDTSGSGEVRLLRRLRTTATGLVDQPTADAKLALLTTQVKALLRDGFHPIVFARFIPTAHYVGRPPQSPLKNVAIEVVTGELPSEERAIRVAALSEAAESGPKVLVATDCLSEGVNLQDAFQAVVHYDLAWNPTRHEQREGRVDRFGQTAPEVKALLLYGEDNGIDGIVLDVLLRKHEKIRKDLGISVPVPPQSDQVLAALLEGILMRGQQADQLTLDLGVDTAAQTLDEQWRSTAEAEKASRTRYAHARIRPDEVQAAVDAARDSLGTPDSVAGFVRTVLEETGTQLTPTIRGFTADLALTPVGLVDALGRPAKPLPFVTDLPAARGTAVLTRTDPRVGAIARYTLDAALDPALPDNARPARRGGVITTNQVTAITVALLVRFRTHLHLPGRDRITTHLAEEARVLAFSLGGGSPSG